MNTDRIIEEAKWVTLMFDQLNTNQTVERIGSRGMHLKNAVEDLRAAMREQGIDPWDVQGGDWQEGYVNPQERR